MDPWGTPQQIVCGEEYWNFMKFYIRDSWFTIFFRSWTVSDPTPTPPSPLYNPHLWQDLARSFQWFNSTGCPIAVTYWQYVIFLSACKTSATVSPKKRKNNRGKPEDVACSDTENSDPKQRLSFAEQDGMLLQTNTELLLNVSIYFL